MRTNLATACLALAFAAPAFAQAPEDFAWKWELRTEAEAPAYRVELDAAVLREVTRADLRDLAAFNADGEPVPFAPWPPPGDEVETREALPWLRVPVPEDAPAEDLRLRLERDADGRLRGLELQASDATPPPPGRHDLLLDRGEEPPPVSVLHVELAPEVQRPVNLRLRVESSDDLAAWTRLGTGLPLVALDDNGLRIERLRLAFAATGARYLRLSIEGEGQWPAIARLDAERRIGGGDDREWKSLELVGQPVEGEPGVFAYTLDAPVQVERIDVVPAAGNSAMAVQVNVRPAGQEWWNGVAHFTAFRLGQGADEMRHEAPGIYGTRDREWRVQATPAPARAPTLVLGYRPDRFVLLAQGPAPYVLVAGSTRTARPDYPVQAALEASRSMPAIASLGPRQEAGGEAALAPRRGEDWQRWMLWAVLALGGLLVVWMSARVLRAPGADPA